MLRTTDGSTAFPVLHSTLFPLKFDSVGYPLRLSATTLYPRLVATRKISPPTNPVPPNSNNFPFPSDDDILMALLDLTLEGRTFNPIFARNGRRMEENALAESGINNSIELMCLIFFWSIHSGHGGQLDSSIIIIPCQGHSQTAAIRLPFRTDGCHSEQLPFNLKS
jgi:hypothetical protein